MLCSLVAWNADGEVVGTLEHLVARDTEGNAVGLVDFEAHESAGGSLKDVWVHSNAVGSGTWPEWLGTRAHDFKVELHDSPAPARARIAVLIHKTSGIRRERVAIEAAIQARIDVKRAEAKQRGDENRKIARAMGMKPEDAAKVPDPEPDPADIRDLLGGPNRPLLLDEDGKTMARPKVERPNLPIIGATPPTGAT